MSAAKQYAVFFPRSGEPCIRTEQGTQFTHFIRMTTKGPMLVRLPSEKFYARYRQRVSASLGLTVQKFLRTAKKVGSMPRAQTTLEYLNRIINQTEKEIIMKAKDKKVAAKKSTKPMTSADIRKMISGGVAPDMKEKMEKIGNGAVEIMRKANKERAAKAKVDAKAKLARMPKKAAKKAKEIADKLAGKKTEKKGSKKAKGERTRATYADNAKITLTSKENPKREGSAAYERFEIARKHPNVKDALRYGAKLGLNTAWLSWNVKEGHLKIS